MRFNGVRAAATCHLLKTCSARTLRVPPPATQAQEVVSTEGYQANDMERALKEAYLRMDELLVKVRGAVAARGASTARC